MRKNLFYIGFLLTTFASTVSAQKVIEPVQIDRTLAGSVKKTQINLATTENTIRQAIQSNQKNFAIELPNETNTSKEKFILTERALLSEELQAKFPMIRSYYGYSTANPLKKVSLSYSPERGINTIVYESSNKYLIEKSGDSYQIIDQQSLPSLKNFSCGTEENESAPTLAARVSDFNNPAIKRKFRLAVATDYDFNLVVNGNQPPTAATSIAAVNQIVTYLTPVYENDLAITFQLVANNDAVSYLTEAEDPFTTSNLNPKAQSEFDLKIGSDNYDIGILFTNKTGGGNAGGIGTVCNNSNKGASYAGGIDPSSASVFAVAVAGHEMGHQFGANHVHSRNERYSANREIGSGVTVMGYAGVTGSHDVTTEDKTLHQFNHYNLRQINNYLNTKPDCGTSSVSTNTPPVASTVGESYNIPKGTAFKLVGSATDADNDILTYSWEQSNPLVTSSTNSFKNSGSRNTEGANFRVYEHSTNPVAFFPPLKQVLAGNLRTTWNTVSDVARDLNFVLQVRDNQLGGGQIDSKEVVVSVKNVGPFQITGLNLNQTLIAGQPLDLTWDVAGTDANNINVSNVRIKLTTDKGQTFTTLVESTPNNGQATITIPAGTTAESAYIVVEAIDNIFYAMSPELAINYEISLDCKTFSTTRSYAIPDYTNTYGSVSFGINVSGQTGVLENFAIKTDVNHTYSGDLVFMFAKGDVDTYYQTVTYENCGSKPNYKYIFTEFGGNLFDNCGVTNANVSPLTLDYNSYNGTPINGQYYFRFVDLGPGDTGTVNSVQIETCSRVAQTLSTGDVVKKSEFNIYPNPSNGNFSVRLATKAPSFTAEVVNLAGQSVFSKKFTAQSTSSYDYAINVSHLPKGVYLVKVDDGNQTQTKKLIIK